MDKLIKILKLNEFAVPDINLEKAEIIFVLESPHVDEVKNKYPLAGRTGKAVSKILFNKSEAFGSLIESKELDKYGIMNISQIPLQSSAYDCNMINNKTCKIFRIFNLIRNNPKIRKRTSEFPKEDINKLINKLSENFNKRVYEINQYQDKKYILCGTFAQEFFNSKKIIDSNIIKVPHPSFNNWNKKKFRDDILSLNNFLKSNLITMH